MYCNSCGSPIPDDARFCGRCGKVVASLPTSPAETARARLARHLPALALLWAIYSVLRILAGGAMVFAGSMLMPGFLFTRGRPFAFSFFGWPFSRFMLHGLIAGAGVGVLLLGMAGLAAGWGLWHREGWARVLALILGVLALFHFPLGTALGTYTLWVLVPRDAAAEYGRPVERV
jgi:predicted nucleic acid-binding Zn ribbon protein